VLNIGFTTRLAEQVAAVRAILWRTTANRIMFALFVLLPLAMAALAHGGRIQERTERILLALTAFGVVFWWAFPWYMASIVRRRMSHPDGPYDVTLDDKSVRIHSPAGVSELKWPAFLRARETRGFFLLYVGESQAQFIPKRALAPEECQLLRDLIERHLGGRAQLAARS
jgi:hypothetical protein